MYIKQIIKWGTMNDFYEWKRRFYFDFIAVDGSLASV